jgi:hypothetical protein
MMDITNLICDKAVEALKSQGHNAYAMKWPSTNWEKPTTWGVWVKVSTDDPEVFQEFRLHDDGVIWWADKYERLENVPLG